MRMTAGQNTYGTSQIPSYDAFPENYLHEDDGDLSLGMLHLLARGVGIRAPLVLKRFFSALLKFSDANQQSSKESEVSREFLYPK